MFTFARCEQALTFALLDVNRPLCSLLLDVNRPLHSLSFGVNGLLRPSTVRSAASPFIC